ncbi:SseB family protein [Streptacidiphilus sp. ASG 303]|uniref:SseB family protein n=1 Tax=Streptacidiphilus sp. ASG 303 TaxID=2896847 RepID=UPI001E29C5D3|nr:SseB family protein [Streptacidiphilus sp. ASG 303]MCD0481300.1 SseB family protein [Streptacidiphilus sp. ASG 303]
MERKNIPDPGFAGDGGAADPHLAAALARWADDPAAVGPEVLAALPAARLMVPVVAVLGEVETGPDGLRREKTSDMAVPVVEAPDGRRALPAFTSLESLARWRADARPVPVHGRQAVLAAYSERADTLLVDPAGPVAYQLTGAPMRAVAEGRAHVPPARDPEVLEAVRRVVADEPAVLRAYLRPAEQTDAVVALVPGPDADEAAVRGAAQRIAAALAADELLRVRLDLGLDLALLPAAADVPGEPLYTR